MQDLQQAHSAMTCRTVPVSQNYPVITPQAWSIFSTSTGIVLSTVEHHIFSPISPSYRSCSNLPDHDFKYDLTQSDRLREGFYGPAPAKKAHLNKHFKTVLQKNWECGLLDCMLVLTTLEGELQGARWYINLPVCCRVSKPYHQQTLFRHYGY